MPTEMYGLKWGDNQDPLEREFHMIRNGGQWQKTWDDGTTTTVGLGLFEHYKNAYKLLWPNLDQHRWSLAILELFVSNQVSVLMGCSDSTKSYSMGQYILTNWWMEPEKTLWLVSSTELRGAELRIWGVLKQLFNQARERYPNLPGSVLEGHHAITTDSISKDQSKARLLSKGIIFVPCVSNGKFVGMGKLIGCKPPPGGRMGHCGDEVSAMSHTLLDAYTNWMKPNFQGILAGNPYDLEDALCRAGEPVDGWGTWKDTEKTQTWKSRFYDAGVLALDGRDSPNNDPLTKNQFKYLIGSKKINAVEKYHGKESWQFYNQCVGKPRPGAMARRVITRQLCDEFRAFDDVMWSGKDLTSIAACDAAYGGVGGDRCVGGHVEFGEDVEGNMVLACYPPVIVPVSVKKTGLPEDQIASFMKEYCETFRIPPENFYFDGRSTLAMAFSRIWSPQVNAVDFGGIPTDRVVSLDTYIWDGDVQSRRLQKCYELYCKFVTELWFTVHYMILSCQMRRLPKEVAEEGYKREWHYTKNNRIEIETKADMKERTGQSPDMMDWLVTACEGARRRGFEIKSLALKEAVQEHNDWLDKAMRHELKELRALELNYK